MRSYSQVSPLFWIGATGRRLRKLGPEHQLTALYLLTSPGSNMLGLYYLPLCVLSHETGLSEKGAKKALQGLVEAGFCDYDAESELVWVHEMAAYQIAPHLKAADKRAQGVLNELRRLPKTPLKAMFYEHYKERFSLEQTTEFERDRTEIQPSLPMPHPRGSEGASEPLASQEQEQEQEIEQEQEEGKTRARAQDADDALPARTFSLPMPGEDAPPLDVHREDSTPKPKKSRPKLDLTVLPESLDREIWDDWLKHRRAIRAPINTQTAVNRVATELKRCVERGISPNIALSEAIDAGWRGMKADWVENRIKSESSTSEANDKWVGLNTKDYGEGINPDGTF